MEANNDTAIYFELLAEERQAKAEQNRLDAQRYRKIKALHTMSDLSEWENLWKSNALNSAVDALPDPNENSNRSR